MAGVGKTTLAHVVFDDKAVEMFNLRSWVCVSDDFDILRITKSILESITFSPNSLKDLNQIQVQLREAVAGKKFLIVLDDVWSKNYSLWNTLKSPFRAGASGSKILVTTRSTDVALTVGTAEYYNLKLLSDEIAGLCLLSAHLRKETWVCIGIWDQFVRKLFRSAEACH